MYPYGYCLYLSVRREALDTFNVHFITSVHRLIFSIILKWFIEPKDSGLGLLAFKSKRKGQDCMGYHFCISWNARLENLERAVTFLQNLDENLVSAYARRPKSTSTNCWFQLAITMSFKRDNLKFLQLLGGFGQINRGDSLISSTSFYFSTSVFSA